ncbi:response regulator [Seleniivibrio woodruffii]|uniref:Regulatory ArsR family protein n=1 Tax=Seleniivibrio woodruffii TaxID=1078050 RepID=A0A4R1K850_9BACT|nr:response regulator [Seleniivibrio woodruffii]TCK60476.1 regulatory ArsR family protein [Seleniivibrio woodruffii]TVZ36104.1 regulatory ArsR family protein [Seleniivibrio woodruffii]
MDEKILIVDDDDELRSNIDEILVVAGFQTRQASGASEAMKMIQADCPDLIIVDYMMPEINGMELISSVKKSHPSVKIIMITAFAAIESAVEAMKKGADDYISKPFKKDALILSVRKNLEEVRFARCIIRLNMDDTLSCISNNTRRQILMMLFRDGKMRFMDITRALGIEDHTKVNFHLKALKQNGLIEQNEDKEYLLSAGGLNVIDCLQVMSSKVSS